MKKVAHFTLKLILIILILFTILIFFYFINKIFKIWDTQLYQIQSQLKQINRVFFMQLITGISVGTILLLIFIIIFPFLTKKVNTKEYIKNIILGVVASFVFFVSQTVYQYFGKIGKYYLVLSIIVTIIITIIIVELISLSFKSDKKEVEFRTSILSCIASGLIFGIVLNIVFVVLDYFKIVTK